MDNSTSHVTTVCRFLFHAKKSHLSRSISIHHCLQSGTSMRSAFGRPEKPKDLLFIYKIIKL